MPHIFVACDKCSTLNRIAVGRPPNSAVCGKCRASLSDPTRPISVNGEQLMLIIHHAELPVVVDFWAPWCGPCRTFASVFERAAATMNDSFQFLKVNTQENSGLAQQSEIRGIPTIVLYDRKQEVRRVSGAMDYPMFSDWLQLAARIRTERAA